MQATVKRLSEKAEINGKPFDQLRGLLLILALITSNMRSLKSLTIKFVSIFLFVFHLSNETEELFSCIPLKKNF